MQIRGITLGLAAGFSFFIQSVGAAPISYTAEQAAVGKKIYQQTCAGCHRPGGGSGVTPVLVDDSFKTRWGSRPVADLYNAVKRMPPGRDLGDENYIKIVAHLLNTHGIEADNTPLPVDAKLLLSLIHISEPTRPY